MSEGPLLRFCRMKKSSRLPAKVPPRTSTHRSGFRTPVEFREVFRDSGNAESTGLPTPEMSFAALKKAIKSFRA